MIAQNPKNNRRPSPCLFSPAPVRVSDLPRVWLFSALLWFGASAAKAVAAEDTVADLIAAGHWPQFRGPRATGVADRQNLPEHWNGVKGENVRFQNKVHLALQAKGFIEETGAAARKPREKPNLT